MVRQSDVARVQAASPCFRVASVRHQYSSAITLIAAPSQQTPGHPDQAYMAVEAIEPKALPIE